MRIPLTHTLALLAALAAGSPALGQVTINLPDYDLTAPTKEIAESKGKELNWSADRFAELFAVRPPKGNVILQDNPNAGGMPPQAPGGNWTLPWFAGAMPGMPAGMAGAGGMKAMTHEAAHLQLVHLVNDDCDDALKQSFNGYGSYLPDWIDESVAVYHEPDGQKKERRQQLKAILSKHIPFPKYFTMDHPIGGKGAAGLPPGMQPPPGGGVGGGVLKPGQMKGMEGANDYYVQSLSVIEYFCDRSGKPFFRFCVSEMQKGRSMDEVLEAWHGKKKLLKKLAKASKKAKSARRKKKKSDDENTGTTIVRGGDEDTDALADQLLLQPGERVDPLPRSVKDLERDWMKWVARKYPGYDPGHPRYPN